MLRNGSKNEQFEQYLDGLEEYFYPINYANFKLEIIQWAQELINKSNNSITWPDELNLKNKSSQVLEDEALIVKCLRLQKLRQMEIEVLDEIEIAKLMAPEKCMILALIKLVNYGKF